MPSSDRAAVEVATSLGPARAHCDPVDGAVGRLLLGHGAGGGVDAPDLLAVRDAAVRAGWAVARVEQPWRVAGKRVAPAPARLDTAWLEVVDKLCGPSSARPGFGAGTPLVVGGRSAGARVACRTAAALGAVGVLCLAFPLHPPGRPERSRAGELPPDVHLLVVQGGKDPFGGPADVSAAAPPRARVVGVDGDHSLRRDLPAVAAAVTGWLADLSG